MCAVPLGWPYVRFEFDVSGLNNVHRLATHAVRDVVDLELEIGILGAKRSDSFSATCDVHRVRKAMKDKMQYDEITLT